MGLYALHRITAGDVILVLGASGSVGSILSRWARALGATVIGVAGSPEKLAKVEAGATHALFASDPELSTKIRAIAQAGVDVVYDFVGKATFPVGVAAVRDGGVIAAIGAASGPPPEPRSMCMAEPSRSLRNSSGMRSGQIFSATSKSSAIASSRSVERTPTWRAGGWRAFLS